MLNAKPPIMSWRRSAFNEVNDRAINSIIIRFRVHIFFVVVGNVPCDGNQRTYNNANGIYFGQIKISEILKFIYQLFTMTFKWHILNIENVSVPDVASIEMQ